MARPLASDRPAPAGRQASGVAQVMLRVARLVQEKRGTDDLHAVQWAALRYFARAGRRAATVQGLAAFLSNTNGSASRTVKSLAERHLLHGEPLREDGRSTSWSLTEAGRAVLLGDPLHDLAEAVATLDAEEMDVLGELLDQVQTALERRRR